MKYRYLIIDAWDNKLHGTNDVSKAEECRDSDEHIVIDTVDDKWLLDGKTREIPELQ